jgi:hypothetical protein
VVDTPPQHRARYGAQGRAARRLLPLRTVALVTAVFAVGVLVGLVYDTRHSAPPGPGRSLGVVPPQVPSALSTTGAPSATATAPPSTRPTGRPSGRPRPSTAPSATSARPSLTDDFATDPVGAAPPAGWLVDDGQWAGIVDDGGHVVRHGSGQPLAHLVAGSPRWSDYAVGADVTTALLDLGFAGVAGRYQDPGNDYECGLGVGGQLQLWLVLGGGRQLLAASSASLDLGSRHSVLLQVRGAQLTCSLDGTPTLQATDTTFATGRVALVATTGEAAEFGRVRVTS